MSPAHLSLRPSTRHYRGSPAASFFLLLARLIFPLAIYCLFFAGAFLWRSSAAATATALRAEVLWMRQAEALVCSAAASGRLLLQVEDDATFAAQLQRAEGAIEGLQWAVSAVLNGDASAGTRAALSSSPVVQTLWKENGCTTSPLYSAASCPAFAQGLITKGLSGALARAAVDAKSLWRLRASLLREGRLAEARALLGDAAFQADVRPLLEGFLPGGLASSTAALLKAAEAQLDGALGIELLLAVVSLIALLGGYAAIYERRVWAMDAEIKQLREVMLLLPDEVATLVPSFAEAAARLGGGGGVSGLGGSAAALTPHPPLSTTASE